MYQQLIKLVFQFFLLFFGSSLFAQSGSCDFTLKNADFEEPDILAKYGSTGLYFESNANMPGWQTTASDGKIEIWRNGLEGVPAYSGKQFVELNANMVSALYIDALTIPGTTITFGFAHRGRKGIDVLELKVGPPGGPYVSLGKYSTGKTAWKYYTTNYMVPAGQSVTRFYFSSFSSSGGNATIGNYLDKVDIIDINIDMHLSASSSCGAGYGKIEATVSAPAGVVLEYSLDNINFQSSPIFDHLSPGNYTVYLKANGICMNPKTIVVKVTPAVLVNLGSDFSMCEGSSVTLDAGNSGAIYSWNNAKTSQSISVSPAGSYFVEVTDTNGCKGYDTIEVRLLASPLVDLGPDQKICLTSFATFDAGNLGASYLWSNGATTQTISVNTNDDYFVEVVDANGCKGRDTVHLQVASNLSVNLGRDKEICDGDSVLIDADNPGSTFSWSTGLTTQKIIVKNSGAFFVEVTDTHGCKGSDTISVAVNPNPVVSLGADLEICQGKSASIDAGNIGSTYLWSNTATTKIITVNSSNIYFVEVTDAKGCKGRDTIKVDVLNPPLVSLGLDEKLCEGETAILDAGNVGSTYLWNTGETSQSIIVNSTSNYSLEVTDAKGCKGYDTVLVQVHANPNVNLGADKEFCEGSSVTLDAGNIGANYLWNTSATSKTISVSNSGNFYVEVIDTNGCKGYDTIQTILNLKSPVNLGSDKSICEGDAAVTFDAGNVGATFLWSNGSTTQRISTSAEQVYFVEVTNAKGCVSNDTVALVVNAKPIVDLGNSALLCKGKSLVLDAQNVGSTFTWNNGASTSKITVNQAGIYTVTVLNSKGCSASHAVTISVDSVTNPISYTDTLICEGDIILLQADINNGNNILWHGNNQDEITVSTSGTYFYTANKGTCADTFAINVNALEVPEIAITDLYGKSYYCFETEKTILQLSGESLVKYSIQWKDTAVNSDKFEVNKAGEYAAIISNEKCSTEVKIFVKEYCSPTFFIPNTFTPNGDGNNDFFPPQHSGVFQDYQIYIFNRWGELIFTSNDISAGWDGKVNGRDVQIDVYVYRISYSINNDSGAKKMEERIGVVNVIR